MPDFLKKAERQLAKVCAPGEEPLAAVFVRPRIDGETRRLGAPAAVAGQAPAIDDGGSINQNAVLVLTSERILAFGHGSLVGRVKGLIGQFSLDDVVELTLDVPDKDAKVPATLALTLRNGETTVVTPGSRRKQFLAAFEKVQSATSSS